MTDWLTKKREDDAWRIYVAGRRTSLFIVKGERPRYREPQTYQLWSDPENHHATGNSVAGLMALVKLIATEALAEPQAA